MSWILLDWQQWSFYFFDRILNTLQKSTGVIKQSFASVLTPASTNLRQGFCSDDLFFCFLFFNVSLESAPKSGYSLFSWQSKVMHYNLAFIFQLFRVHDFLLMRCSLCALFKTQTFWSWWKSPMFCSDLLLVVLLRTALQ